jgi:hypothetical protein
VRSMTSLASSHELDAEALERAITRPLPTARGKSVPITSRESYFKGHARGDRVFTARAHVYYRIMFAAALELAILQHSSLLSDVARSQGRRARVEP